MKLKPGYKEEYQRRHSEIWPELLQLLKSSGICQYSIYFDEETNYLFAVQQVNGAASSQELGTDPVVQKWWSYMSDIMETNQDLSPVSIPLAMLFHME